ncbi:MAG: PDZ domain-containing protein [Chitinophagales bacterium]
MKKFLVKIAGLSAILFLLNGPVFSQNKAESDNERSEHDKIRKNDEIIIIRKGDKDGKVTVEVKDGQVLVNGKALNEFEDDIFSVRRRKMEWFDDDGMALASPHSPFRGGVWNHDGDNLMYLDDSKTAFLGVYSKKANNGGAEIEEVTKGSAAEKIGLKKGDIITKIDEKKVDDPDDLVKVVRSYKPEDKVVITYNRDGKEMKGNAVLGKHSSDFGSLEFSVPELKNDYNFKYVMPPGGPRAYSFNYNAGPRIGIKAQDTENGKGVKVLDVDDDSPAGKAGIKEGDIITQFDGKPVNNSTELADLARTAKTKPSIPVKLIRAGKTQDVTVKIPRKLKTAEL